MSVRINVVNMVPRSLSNEAGHDREPNLTVNPANPRQLVGTAFTPDPARSSNAPVYVSNDGGETWMLNAIVPGSTPFSGIGTADITPRFSSRALYVGDIRVSDFKMDIARTMSATSPVPMSILEEKPDADQPFVEAATVTMGPDVGMDRVFVGNNDFGAPGGKTATVDRSLDALGAAGFSALRIETRATAGQDGPSVRTAIHSDGTIYAAFFGWRSMAAFPTVVTDVVVVRDDSWTAGLTPFSALTDPLDSLPGTRVVSGRTVIWNQLLAQQRTGSQLTIAVDPNDSSTVYLGWCDQQVGGYTLHVRRSTDRGVTWSPTDLLVAERTTNPALAINAEGRVGLLYQQLQGIAPTQRWETHFRLLMADGMRWEDYLLSTAPSNQPIAFNYLGDYAYLAASGRDFCGIFCANNTPDLANFPQGVRYQRDADFATHTLLGLGGTMIVPVSIDPFFFRVTQEPPGAIPPEEPEPCGVAVPEIQSECVSPPAPAWLPYSQCISWYETRFVGEFPFIFRVVYEHCMVLLGRQQGPLLYTVTLLPGEKVKLFHFDRYRRVHATTDVYSVLSSLRTSVETLRQNRTFGVSEDVTVFFPFAGASAQSTAESFQQTVRTASQQVETERSVVVSTYEDKEQIDTSSRTLENTNECYAVSYFVRRVYESFKMTTRVVSVEWSSVQLLRPVAVVATALPQPRVSWRPLADAGDLTPELQKTLARIAVLLPKVGESVEDPRTISLPTDGVVYEAELAHCPSCEPDRIAAAEIALEKAKAEERGACFNAELVALEIQRRKALLAKGELGAFEPSPSPAAAPSGSGP